MKRIQTIKAPDAAAFQASKAHWDSIAKPLGSFGELEALIMKIAAVQGTPDVSIDNRTAVVFCADHGVVAEGVTQTDASVTAICAEAIACGRSNVNAIARQFDTKVQAVDIGMLRHPDCKQLLDRRIAAGTHNMANGAAMSREEAVRAVTVGIDLARDLQAAGNTLLLTGEMGIGNTTPTSAIASVLLGKPPAQVTGRGAGLSTEGLRRKIAVVERAIAVNAPDPDDPLDILAKLGGFEIAGMTGLFLGGAVYRIPVVIDGVISACAAALACRIEPLCAHYILPSHTSGEPAGEGLMALMGLHPVIDAGLRLGEGTGALLLLPLLEGALSLYRNAHRFDDTPIERYTPQL